MANHFNLTQEDFAKNKGLFEALEIRSNDVVGKNYKELSDFLKKRHRRLILTYHPDKGEKGISIEIFVSSFGKGCEIYADKNTKDLLEEDPRDRVHKETDLLKWYDPRLLLMPIIMPLVRMCFSESASELAERNLDEVNTNMSDVNKPPEQPKAIQSGAEPLCV